MKSTENTVFVRFVPASSDIQRHHLEDYFGNIGPIKKCSVIRKGNNNKTSTNDQTALGYGFIKFVSAQDAEQAAKTTNGRTLRVNNKTYRLKVELASNSITAAGGGATNKRDQVPQGTESKSPIAASTTPTSNTDDDEDELLRKRKRTCRVIVRNLSFYANETHIRTVLQQHFGPIVEITLPRVVTNNQSSNNKQHRGFAFVTFETAAGAQKATQPRETPILIKKRPVAIDYSVSKMQHQQEQNNKRKSDDEEQQNHEEEENAGEVSDASTSGSDDDSAPSDDESNDSDASEAEETMNEDDSSSISVEETAHPDKPPPPPVAPEHDEAVQDKRTLFVRNLPFDATRHDLFELLSGYGHIASIYLVKDKQTGVAKGTAFCSFQQATSAQRVLDDAGSTSSGGFVTQREGSTPSSTISNSGGLYLRGRRLFVDLAVDKRTASTLTAEKRQDGTKIHGKDRRNLYLKMEGRVANQADGVGGDNLAWESLPESDQLKRQRAFAEKNTKLRSPLFFINPNRLSIRNLAKHVDEAMFKKLVVTATRRGLETNLVAQEDQVAHWRAGGELTTRDIIKKISEAKERNRDDSVIPVFDDKNVKKFVPSVFIDRDFTTNKKEKAPSRGFGFVDFQEHAHALACLRELNNNPYYSAEFVAGGKRASEAKRSLSRNKSKVDPSQQDFVGEDGRVQAPRLIVDFTVENKAKAKKQAEHRVQQQANIEKQKLERKEKVLSGEVEVKKQKKSRGKVQREKKRQKREGDGEATVESAPEPRKKPRKEQDDTKKVKPMKPRKKKRKSDKDDEKFESLVATYRHESSSIISTKEQIGDGAAEKARDAKRWFED